MTLLPSGRGGQHTRLCCREGAGREGGGGGREGRPGIQPLQYNSYRISSHSNHSLIHSFSKSSLSIFYVPGLSTGHTCPQNRPQAYVVTEFSRPAVERVAVISLLAEKKQAQRGCPRSLLGNGGMDAGFRPLAPEAVVKWDGPGSSCQDKWCRVSCLWDLRLM